MNLKASKEEYMGGFEGRKGQEKIMCLYYYKVFIKKNEKF